MELFATFDRAGNATGLVSRTQVHALGLWHRSAQVFVFNADNALLVQQRAADKDLYAGLWDYSVGEHLIPGESYIEGAQRGLREELDIASVSLERLGGERWVEQIGADYADREIQQAFRCSYAGAVRPDPAEVAQVRYIAMVDLHAWVTASPADFTPWFVEDMRVFGFFGDARGVRC